MCLGKTVVMVTLLIAMCVPYMEIGAGPSCSSDSFLAVLVTYCGKTKLGEISLNCVREKEIVKTLNIDTIAASGKVPGIRMQILGYC